MTHPGEERCTRTCAGRSAGCPGPRRVPRRHRQHRRAPHTQLALPAGRFARSLPPAPWPPRQSCRRGPRRRSSLRIRATRRRGSGSSGHVAPPPIMGSLPPVESSPPARRHEGAWDGCCRAFSKGFLPCALTSPRTVERSAVRIALPRSAGTATPAYASSSAIANKLKRRCPRDDEIAGFRISESESDLAIHKIRQYGRIYVQNTAALL